MSFRRAAVAIAAIATAASAPPSAGGEPEIADATAEIERCASRDGVESAERRRRALQHYNRGAVYYEQGEYEAAVEEFVASYCDAPSPQTFFNIGQAYERLLDFETAVAYFERFLREADPEARNVRRARVRVRVLRRLPARVRVATVPEAARISMLAGKTLVATGTANADTPIQVGGGEYLMRVELEGYETVEKPITVAIGQPYSYYFRLEKKRGALRVHALPRSARIFVDDRLVGVGSYAEQVPIGRYRIRVEADQRDSVERQVEVSEERAAEEVVRLADPEKSGRWELITAGTLMGLFAGGASLGASDLSDATKGLISLGGGALALGSAIIGVPRDITVGRSSFIITSALAGAIEGAAISSLFLCKQTEEGDTECDPDEAVPAIAVGGMVGGLVFGSLTASRFDLDAGDAAILNSGLLWGSGIGLLFYVSFDENPDLLAPMVLAGLNLGLTTGAILGSRVDVSRRRVALIDLAGVGGGVAGFALAEALDAQDERTAHVALVGVAAGLIAGTYLTRFVDEIDAPLRGVAPATGVAMDVGGERALTLGARLTF
jgi:tetratricopeptide (TPR) repeat protein